MASNITTYMYFKYNAFSIERFYYSLPLWRRILAHYFEKYKIGKEEYDAWFDVHNV